MSALLVDLKYAAQLASRVKRFTVKKQSPYLANFRCDRCGDSQSNPNARKAFIYQSKIGRLRFKCHRCAENHGLGYYLKLNHPDLASAHSMEEFEILKLKQREEIKADPILTYTKPKFETSGILKKLSRISQLPQGHKGREYVVKRKLPTKSHSRFYFVLNFKAWFNEFRPGTYKNVPKIDPRLVIPLIDREGNLFALQGRAMTDKQPDRYITQKFDEDAPKIYGLDRIDPNKLVYVLEGPIDSEFVENSIAMAGSDVSIDEIIAATGTTKDRLVFVYDNEPRNPHIHKRMMDKIANGYKVVIWPSFIKQKDINAMILETRYQMADIQLIIEQNTRQGLAAELDLTLWAKV